MGVFKLRWRKESPLDVYKLALGAFLFLSPWLLALAYPAARIDAWICGLLLMAVSAAALVAFADLEEWSALVVGVWMLASPWALGLPHAATRLHIGVGLLVAYLAGLELWLVHFDTPRATTSRDSGK
jgi:hypothetical protein